jgi:hypothetical protein
MLCSLTVLSCIDPSVRIVTKSPKVGPLLLFYISLGQTMTFGTCLHRVEVYGSENCMKIILESEGGDKNGGRPDGFSIFLYKYPFLR